MNLTSRHGWDLDLLETRGRQGGVERRHDAESEYGMRHCVQELQIREEDDAGTLPLVDSPQQASQVLYLKYPAR